MKHLLLGLCSLAVLGAAVAWSAMQPPRPAFEFDKQERNPVTHFRFNDAPADFQFAIVTDRTGGHRPKVFSRAVKQINLLQPEFVVSVGDLIEGYTEDQDRLAKEWREFQSYVSQLQMPFFYVPGNHDITNLTQEKLWKEKFGRRYYDFVYRNVLFLLLNSEDAPDKDEGHISAEQLAFIRKSLDANPNVKWTLVFLHKPMWDHSKVGTTGWLDVEALLKGRPHTVFAGHVHRYRKFTRNGGQAYYMLATTGGGSKLRGKEYGEFDHFVWVTMKKDGPVLANVMVDGVMPEDLHKFDSDEEGVTQYYLRPTQPVRGLVTYDGKPLAGADVVLQSLTKEPRAPRADGVTNADGSFTLSTYAAFDGVPAGEYSVTVVLRRPRYDATGKLGPNLLPEKYAKADTSGLKATIKTGTNELTLKLDK